MASENLGALVVDYVTVDITSLTNAGGEPISSWLDKTDISVIEGASVVGQSDGGYHFAYDHTTEEVHAKYPVGSHTHNVPADSSGTTANAEFDANGNLAVGSGGSIEGSAATTGDDVPAGTAVGEVKLRLEGRR